MTKGGFTKYGAAKLKSVTVGLEEARIEENSGKVAELLKEMKHLSQLTAEAVGVYLTLRLVPLYTRRHLLRSIGSREWIVEVCRLV